MAGKKYFGSIITDKGKRTVTTYHNNVRGKRRIVENIAFKTNEEQVAFLNVLANAINSKEDIDSYKKLAETKYFSKFKNEVLLISKVFGYQEENNLKENKEKYILVGDIKSGKSYIISMILAEVLKREKREFIDILTGMGETTVSLFNFIFRYSTEEGINLKYELINDLELNEIAEETLSLTFRKIKEKEEGKKDIKSCVPKQVALNTFRLKRIIGDRLYYEIEDELTGFYIKNKGINEDEFIESKKDIILSHLKNLKVNINLELERYKDRQNISIDEFKEILKYIANKKNASFFREVEFKIYSSLKREFEIIDSIGLNHGEGIKKDAGLLREARLLNIISKYPSHKIIYILNCMTTTSATLKPIEFIEKMGALSKTIMVVSQLDRENITFDEFIEEKINDRIDDEFYEIINQRMIEGPLVIEDIFNKFENIKFKEKINIRIDNVVERAIETARSNFIELFNNYINNIHWKRMDSFLLNEKKCIDNYYVGGQFIFSVSRYLVTCIINNITNEQLMGIFNLKEEISEVEFNKMREKFINNLLSLCKVYFINNNVKLIENLYELRWDNNLRIYFDMSMTKERAERFRECVLKYMNNDIIIDLINLSAE